jgi:hypothetical protein
VAVKCTKHPHSSPETAAVCWGKAAGKRADRVIELSGALYHRSYPARPPGEVTGPVVTVRYF